MQRVEKRKNSRSCWVQRREENQGTGSKLSEERGKAILCPARKGWLMKLLRTAD